MDKFDLQEMMDFFHAIKNGTQPKPGEDVQSCMDCWNFLEAHLVEAKKEIEHSQGLFAQILKEIKTEMPSLSDFYFASGVWIAKYKEPLGSTFEYEQEFESLKDLLAGHPTLEEKERPSPGPLCFDYYSE